MKDLKLILFSIFALMSLYALAQYLTGLHGEMIGNWAWYMLFWLPLAGFVFWLVLWATVADGIKFEEVKNHD